MFGEILYEIRIYHWIYIAGGLVVWEWIPCSDCQLSSFSKAKAVCTITPVTKFRIPVTWGRFLFPQNLKSQNLKCLAKARWWDESHLSHLSPNPYPNFILELCSLPWFFRPVVAYVPRFFFPGWLNSYGCIPSAGGWAPKLDPPKKPASFLGLSMIINLWL